MLKPKNPDENETRKGKQPDTNRTLPSPPPPLPRLRSMTGDFQKEIKKNGFFRCCAMTKLVVPVFPKVDTIRFNDYQSPVDRLWLIQVPLFPFLGCFCRGERRLAGVFGKVCIEVCGRIDRRV